MASFGGMVRMNGIVSLLARGQLVDGWDAKYTADYRSGPSAVMAVFSSKGTPGGLDMPR